jgi:hypothetical protein
VDFTHFDGTLTIGQHVEVKWFAPGEEIDGEELRDGVNLPGEPRRASGKGCCRNPRPTSLWAMKIFR